MENQKRCASCAMEISADAKKCPHCRSRQPGAVHLYRDAEHRMIAGVCAGLAREFGTDATFVRLGMALLGVMSIGLAFWGYVVLWVITPVTPTGTAPLTRWVERIRGMFGHAPQGAPQRTEEPTTQA